MPGEVTAVNSPTSDNNIKVFASGKTIIVKGAASDAPVMVKSSNGVLLKSATGNAMIPMENEGIYIVIVGQQTFKVLL